MGYKLFAGGVKALDCSFHRDILARTGRSTRCLQGRGITAVMKEKFFPDYVYRHATGGPVVDRTGKVGAVTKKGRGGGMARGRQVDNEIQRWVKGTVEGHDNHHSSEETVPTIKPPGGLRNVKCPKKVKVKGEGARPWPSFHPFSRAFIALTERLRLTPVATQVVVRDERCNIATLVDAIFLNPKGRVVVVELKTGFEGYNDVSTGRMHAEFAHLTNAPANQHKVQLAFTHAMFERTFPEFGSTDALLIRMTSDGAHVRSLIERDSAAARRAMQKGSSF
jgi:hypothetical protein